MQQQLLFKEFENADILLIQLEARLPTAVNVRNIKIYKVQHNLFSFATGNQ